MTQHDWKQDPRLKHMDPAKLDYITRLAEQMRGTSKNQVIPTFLAIQAEINRKGICFTDAETELLVSILTADMPPAEKKKLETLKFLAKKLAARSS
ncbi:MAG: hypothetical protein MR868_07140 [Lachnospiraceae bacterium]|nr:hypothetical protein [Lachnospiraceae bacterium]